jgi:hypothetical protein
MRIQPSVEVDGRNDVQRLRNTHNYRSVRRWLQGDNGAEVAGFPAFHEDKVHASPLLYDIDHDGIQDILLSTYNGEILFYQDSGKKLSVALSLPSLPVDRHVPLSVPVHFCCVQLSIRHAMCFYIRCTCAKGGRYL